jgi:hypothetical protein
VDQQGHNNGWRAFVSVAILVAFLAVLGSGGRREPIKTIDSMTASEGVNCAPSAGSLARGELGDVFLAHRQPRVETTRCTWLDEHFSRMRRHELFDVTLRFDQYQQADAEHAAVMMIRPVGTDLEGDVCGLTGNREILFVRLYVDWEDEPDHWKVQLRGGESPWAQDQLRNVATIDLGPVVEGRTIDVTFGLFFDYKHGAATIWKDGDEVYDSPDRPLGFHFNCEYRSSNADATPNTGARDLSHSYLHMQFGIYRAATPEWQLTSSGVRVYCAQEMPCTSPVR